jgi:hypothetical protein
MGNNLSHYHTLYTKKYKEHTTIYDNELSLMCKEFVKSCDYNSLYIIYKQFVMRAAYGYYKYYRTQTLDILYDFDDFVQECWIIFFKLVQDYDSKISSFTYYIKTVFKRCIRDLTTSLFRKVRIENISTKTYIYLNTLEDPHAFTGNILCELILKGSFISLKNVRDKAYKKRLYKRLITRGEDIGILARKYNVTYHAINCHLIKFKKEIADFVNTCPYANYYIDMSNVHKDEKHGTYFGEYIIKDI